jgi:hypothetical protein
MESVPAFNMPSSLYRRSNSRDPVAARTREAVTRSNAELADYLQLSAMPDTEPCDILRSRCIVFEHAADWRSRPPPVHDSSAGPAAVAFSRG